MVFGVEGVERVELTVSILHYATFSARALFNCGHPVSLFRPHAYPVSASSLSCSGAHVPSQAWVDTSHGAAGPRCQTCPNQQMLIPWIPPEVGLQFAGKRLLSSLPSAWPWRCCPRACMPAPWLAAGIETRHLR
eukprot:190654-Rhodomonas_salina.1